MSLFFASLLSSPHILLAGLVNPGGGRKFSITESSAAQEVSFFMFDPGALFRRDAGMDSALSGDKVLLVTFCFLGLDPGARQSSSGTGCLLALRVLRLS